MLTDMIYHDYEKDISMLHSVIIPSRFIVFHYWFHFSARYISDKLLFFFFNFNGTVSLFLYFTNSAL